MRPLATMQLGISSAEGVVRSLKGSFQFTNLLGVALNLPSNCASHIGPLSSTCRMSACRFFAQKGNILCRVGDMSPTCFSHVADTRKCRVG